MKTETLGSAGVDDHWYVAALTGSPTSDKALAALVAVVAAASDEESMPLYAEAATPATRAVLRASQFKAVVEKGCSFAAGAAAASAAGSPDAEDGSVSVPAGASGAGMQPLPAAAADAPGALSGMLRQRYRIVTATPRYLVKDTTQVNQHTGARVLTAKGANFTPRAQPGAGLRRVAARENATVGLRQPLLAEPLREAAEKTVALQLQ